MPFLPHPLWESFPRHCLASQLPCSWWFLLGRNTARLLQRNRHPPRLPRAPPAAPGIPQVPLLVPKPSPSASPSVVLRDGELCSPSSRGDALAEKDEVSILWSLRLPGGCSACEPSVGIASGADGKSGEGAAWAAVPQDGSRDGSTAGGMQGRQGLCLEGLENATCSLQPGCHGARGHGMNWDDPRWSFTSGHQCWAVLVLFAGRGAAASSLSPSCTQPALTSWLCTRGNLKHDFTFTAVVLGRFGCTGARALAELKAVRLLAVNQGSVSLPTLAGSDVSASTGQTRATGIFPLEYLESFLSP